MSKAKQQRAPEPRNDAADGTDRADERGTPYEPDAAWSNVNVNMCLQGVGTPLTVGELVALYVRESRKRCNAGTVQVLRSRANCLLKREVQGRTIAGMRLAEVTRTTCQRLLLQAANRPRGINEQVRLLGTAYRWGAVVGLLPRAHDPTQGLRYHRQPRGGRALTGDTLLWLVHVIGVAEALEVVSSLWADYARILLGVGLRQADLNSIHVADVDRKSQWMTARQKGDRELHVAYPVSMVAAIERRLVAAQGSTYLFPGDERTEPVQRRRGPLEWKKVMRVAADLKGARDRAGLSHAALALRMGATVAKVRAAEEKPATTKDRLGRPITLVHFRASNVTHKVKAGVSVRLAGASVGHEREETTRTYIGPLFERMHEVASHMDDLFKTTGTEQDPREVVAANIRAIRARRKLSKSVVGQRAGVGSKTVGDWENSANLNKLQEIAKALECTVAELLEGVR
jgi:DNA-binding transcriptional regulator YiaG